MPDIVNFPGGLIIGDRTDPQLVANTRSGGQSINGFEQIISPLSQRWEWTISIPVFQTHHMRGLRAFLARAQGRFNYVRIRVCDMYRPSRREMGAIGTGPVPHSDDALFSDDTGYHLGTGTAPLPTNLAAGVTSLTIDPGFLVQPGMLFSINEWLYVATDVDDASNDAEGWVLEGGEWDDDGFWLTGIDWDYVSPPETQRVVHFMPPLRAPAMAGDEMNFDPIVLWRLASDAEGSANLRAGKFGVVTLSFVEPVGR